MKNNSEKHVSVLPREVLEGLAISPGDVVIDATLGSGGHFSLLLSSLQEKESSGTLLGIDVDPSSVESMCAYMEKDQKEKGSVDVLFARGNFRDIESVAKTVGITRADAILADLGWRTEQFLGGKKDGGGKGFSFSSSDPLMMTYGDPESYGFTAGDIVNVWNEEDIVKILRGYGEERYASGIARAIVSRREEKLIETAEELAAIIKGAVPYYYRNNRIHPATKTFQALRIAVNDELDALREFIDGAIDMLNSGGRLAIISFHSIEDRIVKHQLLDYVKNGVVTRITKKPTVAKREEVVGNPRSRSAKLRIVEKI